MPSARRTMRVFSLDGAIAEYDGLVTVVNSGQPISAALGASGLPRSHFSRKRVIAEASKVDPVGMRNAILQLNKVTLPNIYPFAKDICNRRCIEKPLHPGSSPFVRVK